MPEPLIYVALSPALAEELALEQQLQRLQPVAQIERWPGPGRPDPAVLAEALQRASVVLTGWDTPALAQLLASWSADSSPLRLVAHTAGSVRFLVPRELLERGLLVTHANAALAEAVAEMTLALMLVGRRQIVASALRYKAGQPPVPLQQMRELRGSSVGVIGASTVGRLVLRLLQGWPVTVLLYDPYCSPEEAEHYGARLVDLPELLSASEVVTLHAPLTEQTRGMLGAAEFAAMPDGALFINTARGGLVDHAALLAELQRGRLSAVLDVTDPTEPLPPDSPFFTLENCLVLPHMAANTLETRRRQGRDTVDEILRFCAGKQPRYLIAPAAWDHTA